MKMILTDGWFKLITVGNSSTVWSKFFSTASRRMLSSSSMPRSWSGMSVRHWDWYFETGILWIIWHAQSSKIPWPYTESILYATTVTDFPRWKSIKHNTPDVFFSALFKHLPLPYNLLEISLSPYTVHKDLSYTAIVSRPWWNSYFPVWHSCYLMESRPILDHFN